MSDWAQVAMFWATVGLVIVTLFATMLNYWLVRSQHDPHVVVYAANDPDRTSVIVLVIKNVGKGMAYNVRFASSRPIPWKAWGTSREHVQAPETMDRGPLVNGIPTLAPGETRILNWGQYWGLHAALGAESIKITATYESRGLIPLNPTEHVTESVIEAESFTGTVAHKMPLVAIREDIQKIRESVGHVTTGFKSLHIAAQTQKRDKGAE